MQKIELLTGAVSAALAVVSGKGAAAKSAKGEAVAACRKVAAQGAELGFDHETVGKVWQAVAKLEKRPSGTWKPYTKHVQGFVILSASGVNLETSHDGKPATQADAVEAYKVATTPQAVLDEAARISAAVSLFRLRIGGETVTGFDWAKPDAGTVAELLEMLPAHPTESEDVTEKATKADKVAAEGAAEIAAIAAALGEGEVQPARTGTEG